METWKKIPYYDNYMVSDLGRVKSLKWNKERILKPSIRRGYYYLTLTIDSVQKKENIHKLVAISFLNHIPDGTQTLVVNHKDFDKLNNKLENLEIVTHRENTNRKHLKSTSKYVGVNLDKATSKWRASIRVSGKLKYLGLFFTEKEASERYEEELKRF